MRCTGHQDGPDLVGALFRNSRDLEKAEEAFVRENNLPNHSSPEGKPAPCTPLSYGRKACTGVEPPGPESSEVIWEDPENSQDEQGGFRTSKKDSGGFRPDAAAPAAKRLKHALEFRPMICRNWNRSKREDRFAHIEKVYAQQQNKQQTSEDELIWEEIRAAEQDAEDAYMAECAEAEHDAQQQAIDVENGLLADWVARGERANDSPVHTWNRDGVFDYERSPTEYSCSVSYNSENEGVYWACRRVCTRQRMERAQVPAQSPARPLYSPTSAADSLPEDPEAE